MLVTKRIDLDLLARELVTAGVVVSGLGLSIPEPSPEEPGVLFTGDAAGNPVDLPPEAEPVVAAHDASKPKRAAAFEASEDAERLRIVAERSRTDPAYAALAELALKGTTA